jgi:hypothetical protein
MVDFLYVFRYTLLKEKIIIMNSVLPPKIKYLNNRDLLAEIHKSKNSFSSFTNPEYHQYDIILPNIDKINIRTVAEAKRNRAKRLGLEKFNLARAQGDKKIKLSDCTVNYKNIEKTDLVFRIMTFDHIPLAPGRKKTTKTVADSHEKVNFPPFQHWKFDEKDKLICVGKSHWKGSVEKGKFSKDHGRITENLGRMFIKLSERYAQRSNWRGYCVDETTEALTQRGWANIDNINENDIILSYSYDEKSLAWSKIKSIYRGNFDGLMHKITSTSIDSLITPGHKILTDRGLIEIEYLKQSDNIIVMGDGVKSEEETYTDSFIELVGWIMTEGCYELNKENGEIKRITIYQNQGPKADRIRNCLEKENIVFSESSNKKNICFAISRNYSKFFKSIFNVKNLTMDFILKLSKNQRQLLINTLIDGDGWRRENNNISYTQKKKECIDMVQALITISGLKSNVHYVTDHPSFGKTTDFYVINVFSKRRNKSKGEILNLHGGLRNGEGQNRALGKKSFPNVPTTYYKGKVWCPETEYGSFVARRNGKVYLTGNTYVDEMRGQAILQLSHIGLQFDEYKSENPFAYYTAAVTNSFTRILNLEKKNQTIRDDLLEINGLTPSMTRQTKDEFAEEVAKQAEIYKNIRMPKSQDSDFDDNNNNSSDEE